MIVERHKVTLIFCIIQIFWAFFLKKMLSPVFALEPAAVLAATYVSVILL